MCDESPPEKFLVFLSLSFSSTVGVAHKVSSRRNPFFVRCFDHVFMDGVWKYIEIKHTSHSYPRFFAAVVPDNSYQWYLHSELRSTRGSSRCVNHTLFQVLGAVPGS